MAAITDYLEPALLNHVFRATAFTSPTSIYVALHTADPGETGATGELVGNAYARVAVTFGAPAVDGTAHAVSNSATVTFPAATAAWGTVTHWSLWDASALGNCLWKGALTEARAINNTDEARFATGTLVVKLD